MSSTSSLERQFKYVLRSVAALCLIGTIVLRAPDHDAGQLSVPIVIQSILVWIGAGLAARSTVPFGGLLIFTGFELVRGCVVPLFVQLLGQESPLYRQLGEFPDALVVLLLGNAFFAALLFGTTIAAVLSRTPPSPASRRGAGGVGSVSGSLILISLGLFGLILRFPTQEAIEGFLQGRYEDLQTTSAGGIAELSVLLRRYYDPSFLLGSPFRCSSADEWTSLSSCCSAPRCSRVTSLSDRSG